MKNLQENIYKTLLIQFSGYYTPEFLTDLSEVYATICHGLGINFESWKDALTYEIDNEDSYEMAVYMNSSAVSPIFEMNQEESWSDAFSRIHQVLPKMNQEDEDNIQYSIEYFPCTIGFKNINGSLVGNVRFNKFGEMIGVSAHDGLDSYLVPSAGMNVYPNALYNCVVRVISYYNENDEVIDRIFQVTEYNIVKLTVKSFITERTYIDIDGENKTYKLIIVQAGGKRLYYDPIMGNTDGSRTIDGLCKGIAQLTPNFNKARVINRVKELYNEIA